MTIEQFGSLGDRVDFITEDQVESNNKSGNQYKLNISRRLTFILFEEIIESSPTQFRTVVFDPDGCSQDKELLESVQKHGIITPIIVRELAEDGDANDLFLMKNPGERAFALVAGHRRVAAGQTAGLAGTEGVIAKPSEDHDLITLVENMGRRELTTYEKARALKSLQERRGLSENKTAQLTGISQASINRLFNALKSPGVLRDLWQEGHICATAILTLKEHWQEFEHLESPTLIKKMRELSRSEADSLRDQLGSGTSLQTALNAMERYNDPPPLSKIKKPAKQSRSTDGIEDKPKVDKNGLGEQKGDLLSAIRDVFPKITEEKGKVLFDYALVSSVKDAEVIWAAALFVARGGNLDQAVEICSKTMSNRMYRSLLSREVKTMKRISSILKSKKPRRDLKKLIKTIYIGS